MWSTSILALLCTRCIASCPAGTSDADGSSLLQARSLVRKAHSVDAKAMLKTVSRIAKAFSEGSEVAMSEDDVHDALGDTAAALSVLLPTFAQAHSTAQTALNTALAAVEQCHTESGGEVLARHQRELARHGLRNRNCSVSIAAAEAAEEEACAEQSVEASSCSCGEARKVTFDQRARCQSVTYEYKYVFCEHEVVCNMLEDCHSGEAAAFNTLANSSRVAMVTRQQEYVIVKQVQCITNLIIAAMNASRTINHADMINCSNITTDHLILTFPALPDEPSPCPELEDDDPTCDWQVFFDSANTDFTVGPSRLSGSGRMNWYHTANSARTFSANDEFCGFSFKISSTSAQMVVGVADRAVTYYSHLDWAVYISSTTLYVYRSGSSYFSMAYIIRSTDVHKIFVNQDHHVEFSLNGVVYYSSSTSVSYPWHVAVDAYESPGLSHVEYVLCGEHHLPMILHGDKVMFDQHHSSYTAAPGALTGTGSSWYKTANSAREFGMHDGVCGITFKCNTSTASQMIGLTDTFVTYYSGMDFAIHCTGSGSNTEVYQGSSRQYRLPNSGNGRPDTDVHAIRINENGIVEYALNNVVYLTSSRTLQYPWHVAVDAYSNPSLSDVEYIKCGEGDELEERGDEVEFDVADTRFTVSAGTIVGSTSYYWSAPANSAREFGADDDVCGVAFKCNTSTSHFIMGLATSFVSGFSNIKFGIVCRGSYGAYTDVYESNSRQVRMGGRSGNGDPTRDVHSIRINHNHQVEYAMNGRVWHVSTSTPSYPWHVGFDAYTIPVASNVRYLPCDKSDLSCTNQRIGDLHTEVYSYDSGYVHIDTGRPMTTAGNMTHVSWRCYVSRSTSYQTQFHVWRHHEGTYYDLIAESPWLSCQSDYWGSYFRTIELDSPLFFQEGDYIGFRGRWGYNLVTPWRSTSSESEVRSYYFGSSDSGVSVGSRYQFQSGQHRSYSYSFNLESC